MEEYIESITLPNDDSRPQTPQPREDSSLTENDLIVKKRIEDRHTQQVVSGHIHRRGHPRNIHENCKEDPKGALKRLLKANGHNSKRTDYFICDSCSQLVILKQVEVQV